MKTICCNLTKTFRIFATFTELIFKNMGIPPYKFQENSPVYRRITRLSLSLLYVQRTAFVSILT